jgi:anti-anti-sigma factor
MFDCLKRASGGVEISGGDVDSGFGCSTNFLGEESKGFLPLRVFGRRSRLSLVPNFRMDLRSTTSLDSELVVPRYGHFVVTRFSKRYKVMLKVQITNSGTVVILCLQGRMVRGETEQFQELAHSVSGVKTLVLDFAQLITVDAWGLGVMLGLRKQTKAKGIDFKLMNVPRLISQVLEITCLNTVFEVTAAANLMTMVPPEKAQSRAALARCA